MEPAPAAPTPKEPAVETPHKDPAWEEKESRAELERAVSLTESLSHQTTESGELLPTRGSRKWYRKLNPLRWQKIPVLPNERVVSHEYKANIFSQITFQWMAPIMHVGYMRPLELQDIYKVNPDRSVVLLTEKFERNLQNELDQGVYYPLFWALYKTFKFEFWLGGICALVSQVLQVISPFITRYLIQFATDAYIAQNSGTPGPNIANGIGLAIGITVVQIIQSLCTNQFIYRGFMVGAEAKAVLMSVLFNKSMKLSGRAKAGGKAIDEGLNALDLNASEKNKERAPKSPKVTPDAGKGITGDGRGWSNGRITTLMSVDADRVYTAMGMFHMLWTAPIALLLTLALLFVNISYSAFTGYALLVLGMPFLTISIRSLVIRRERVNQLTDQRVTLTQEIIQSVRFVKFFGWESSFLERLKTIRKREIFAIQILLAIRNAILCISMVLPIFASMLSFITYSLTDHALNPARIFSSLGLFNSIRLPLNTLPMVIGQVTDAWTALGRMQEFLMAEEQKNDVKYDESIRDAFILGHASFTWERMPTSLETLHAVDKTGQPMLPKQLSLEKLISKDLDDRSSVNSTTEPFKLTDLNFTVRRNELLAVIGTVGSGKSSLLAALAGDMRMTAGEARIGGSRAYCPQYAWIQNTSVKSNITFGRPWDEKWYNEVIDACALRPDFDIFPAGDSTEIGERGITVSGGQKQRLNIARAIYFNADIVLLDDPLSAVDAHVGRHIMDNAICGLLKDKCRILATHQLHVLSRCDRIILMDDGRIQAIDTFDNLMRDNERFRCFLDSTAQEEGKEGEDEEAAEGKNKNASTEKVKQQKQAMLMQQEERAIDSVGWLVWKAYISASGSFFNLFLLIFSITLTNVANIMTSLWLSWWSSNKFPLHTGQYIGIYASLGAAQGLFMFAYSTTLSVGGTYASRTMLQRAMTRVLRAPMSFFDTTPMGRITNRFSKDINVMDNDLTDAMRIYYLTVTMIISVIVLIVVFYHYFAIALGPLVVLFFIAADYYRASARDVKRHESVLRSHVFARFGEAITGVSCIRAYGLEGQFQESISKSIDEMDSAYFLTFSNQRWVTVRLDAVGYVMVLVTGLLVVTSRFDVSPSISGLVLSFILSIVQQLQFTVRQLAEVENNMNSTERIHYYGTKLEEEGPLSLAPVEPSWPQQGSITFKHVLMRYRPGLPLVLRGLNMEIQGGERIGIVGRTGAGKSSIMSALFRLTELDGGSITIDGVDISKIGLKDLRSRMAIIPQDPTLFHGTVRSNLDPFNEHTDLELWDGLRKAGLVGDEATEKGSSSEQERRPFPLSESPSPVNTQRVRLDSPVDEEGLNFSLGQRQLMALARALVRNSRIIVCDEATSSVDFKTDHKIQQTMATGFKGKTLLCIAHRLRTIITYDRICVMDHGQIVQLDTPLNLWAQKDGIFRGMCDRSGIQEEDFFQGEEGLIL